MKYVYFFGAGKADGLGDMKNLLGGKGAGLAEMTRIGLPVPAGFTITTEACDYFLKHDGKHPKELKAQVKKELTRLEKLTGKKLGDAKDPLLVSVRSGSAKSMPGMMETILNLGLNEKSVEALAKSTQNERFAYDAYRRFVQMYSSVVIGLPKEDLEERLRAMKKFLNVTDDTQVTAQGWRQLVGEYKEYFKRKTGKPFPEDPEEQLWGAIGAVFESWMGDKAVTYRRVEKITGLLGTAVNVVQMVFGNTGENSGTGVCFTRDPSTGEKIFFGDFLLNAQGEDVVAGIRTPLHLKELKSLMPKVYQQLEHVRAKLEKHYRDMQDMEFTVENGTLYMLQTRTGKRSPAAAFRMAMDMKNEGLIKLEEALERIKEEDVERLFYPVLDPALPRKEFQSRKIGEGINAVPGAAGGKTIHAAVVARGWGKCCIVGAEKIEIDAAQKRLSSNGKTVKQGEWITLDGGDGSVYTGEIALVRPEPPKAYETIMKWADSVRRLGVRANADTPKDARLAREMGAEGIGLTRTEHMFFKDFEHPEQSVHRQRAIQEM